MRNIQVFNIGGALAKKQVVLNVGGSVPIKGKVRQVFSNIVVIEHADRSMEYVQLANIVSFRYRQEGE